MSNKVRNTAITIAATVGVGLGSYGVAAAQTNSAPDPAPATSEAPEIENDVDEAIDSARAAEAKITKAEAADAAVMAVGAGTASDAVLGDEDGTLIYEVDVTDNAGMTVEVAVDAATGKATIDADDADEANEANEADEADDFDQDGIDNQNEHEGENDPNAEHSD